MAEKKTKFVEELFAQLSDALDDTQRAELHPEGPRVGAVEILHLRCREECSRETNRRLRSARHHTHFSPHSTEQRTIVKDVLEKLKQDGIHACARPMRSEWITEISQRLMQEETVVIMMSW